MATTKAKKETKKVNTLTDRAKAFNQNALEFSDNLIDETIATGGEWQDIMAKALKNGTTLFGKQQDLVLDTLEGLKAQYQTGTSRFRKLFELPTGKKETAKPKATKKTAKAKTSKTITAKTTVKATTAKAKKEVAEQDLKVIDGIGPKVESILKAAGIKTYAQLVAAGTTKIKTILAEAGSRYKMHNPAPWVAQAKSL